MRKMFSKGQIKGIVQEGIDNGEIDSLHLYLVTGKLISDGDDEYQITESLIISPKILTLDNVNEGNYRFIDLDLFDGVENEEIICLSPQYLSATGYCIAMIVSDSTIYSFEVANIEITGIQNL